MWYDNKYKNNNEGNVVMSYKKEMESFISKNRESICASLGLKSHEIIDSDLRIMAAYLTPKAGEKHFDAGNGIDSSFIEDLKRLPNHKVGEEILLKAIEAKEKGESLGRRMPNALSKRQLFSPKVEAAMQERRREMSSESFGKLSGNVVMLKTHLKTLAQLLHGDSSFAEPSFRFQIRTILKMISSDLNKCNYQARAGAVWAIKSGISADSAAIAVNQVYLRHLNQLSKTFAPVDELINANGIDCKMSKQIDSIKERWYQEFQEVFQMKKDIVHGNRFVAEPSL